MKTLNDNLLNKIRSEVKILLHASRDCMRDQGIDTLNTRFSSIDSYYSEALGILRGLVLLDYGYFGSSNLDAITELKRNLTRKKPKRCEQNFKWLMWRLEEEVLQEENFYSNHRCKFCLETYGKDNKTMINKREKK